MFEELAYGKRSLVPLLFEAMDKKQLSSEYYTGQWYDIGTPERLKSLDQKLKLCM